MDAMHAAMRHVAALDAIGKLVLGHPRPGLSQKI